MNEEEKQAIEKLDYELTYSWIHNQGISKETLKLFKDIIEKQQKEIKARLKEIDSLYKMMSAKDDEIEELKEDYQILKDDIEEHNITYVDTPEFEEKYISKDKLKEIIEKHKKFLVNEFSHYADDDIENRKAIQYALARLSFLLTDIYKLGE